MTISSKVCNNIWNKKPAANKKPGVIFDMSTIMVEFQDDLKNAITEEFGHFEVNVLNTFEYGTSIFASDEYIDTTNLPGDNVYLRYFLLAKKYKFAKMQLYMLAKLHKKNLNLAFVEYNSKLAVKVCFDKDVICVINYSGKAGIEFLTESFGEQFKNRFDAATLTNKLSTNSLEARLILIDFLDKSIFVPNPEKDKYVEVTEINKSTKVSAIYYLI